MGSLELKDLEVLTVQLDSPVRLELQVMLVRLVLQD